MTPGSQLHCLLKILQFDFCLVSKIFSFFPVVMFNFACNGSRSAAVLRHLIHQGHNRGVWQEPNPLPPSGNRVNLVDSSQSEMTSKKAWYNASIFPAHSKESYPRYCFPRCLLVVACHQFSFMLPNAPLFKLTWIYSIVCPCIESQQKQQPACHWM